MANPYETLGVPKNASADEIKKAYRKLAREHHPDASGGDEARFKEIQGAYDLLSDPEKREAYDTFGSTNGRPAGFDFGGGGRAGAQVPRLGLSAPCGGTGAEPGTAPTVCPQCGGRGVTSDSHGLFALSHPCPRCRGNGTIVEHPCKTCRGSGHERTTKNFNVKIRPGIKDRARIRVGGKGEGGRNGGASGDLYLVVDVEPSPPYTRPGGDLILDL